MVKNRKFNIFLLLGLFFNCLAFGSEAAAASTKLCLDRVDINRIEKLEQVYGKLSSRSKKVKIAAFATTGVATATASLLLLKFLLMDDKKVVDNAKSGIKTDSSKDEIKAAKIRFFQKMYSEEQERRSFLGMIKSGAQNGVVLALVLSISGIVGVVMSGALTKAVELFNGKLGEFAMPLELEEYLFKVERTKIALDRVLQSTAGLKKGEMQIQSDVVAGAEDFVIRTDLMLNHSILVRSFEDLLAFVRQAIIAEYGKGSENYAKASAQCLSLIEQLNAFAAAMSDPNDAASQSEVVQTCLADFFNLYINFTYDNGVCLYEKNFLRI
ncbi:MAG: hypothetical protein V1855_03415 [bacterium]